MAVVASPAEDSLVDTETSCGCWDDDCWACFFMIASDAEEPKSREEAVEIRLNRSRSS